MAKMYRILFYPIMLISISLWLSKYHISTTSKMANMIFQSLFVTLYTLWPFFIKPRWVFKISLVLVQLFLCSWVGDFLGLFSVFITLLILTSQIEKNTARIISVLGILIYSFLAINLWFWGSISKDHVVEKIFNDCGDRYLEKINSSDGALGGDSYATRNVIIFKYIIVSKVIYRSSFYSDFPEMYWIDNKTFQLKKTH